MYELSEIYVYPVKSLGGIKLDSAEVQLRGLKFDRRWMIVDQHNNFLTQRRLPEMALIDSRINDNKIILSHKKKKLSGFTFEFGEHSGKQTNVRIFDNIAPAHFVSAEADKWLTEALGIKCRLVFMTDSDIRPVNKKYAKKNESVSFADGFPYLLIGQASMDLLNSKLSGRMSAKRFRPNFVFTGGEPHDEDNWSEISIGKVRFDVVKPCSRCVITTVNQETGEKGKEPLFTLSTYRKINNKVLFGQNMIAITTGTIYTGEKIEIINVKK